ncbi:CAR1 transcription factor [Topomyia yanbarensis]|uniref:CAR1 transcription factor n=1 Tax=Topomyia yanbarensis TaxID=2498891 RepID=UPI00273BCF7F|nr:CAR1 transcription factor [Topomyia yanbarensis]
MPSGGNKKPPHKGSGSSGGASGGKGSKAKHNNNNNNNNNNSSSASNRNPSTRANFDGSNRRQQPVVDPTNAAADVDEEYNSGFGQYLRSPQAVDMMKLFVIANTLMVFFTVAWPQMQQSFEVIKSLIFGEGDDEDEL